MTGPRTATKPRPQRRTDAQREDAAERERQRLLYTPDMAMLIFDLRHELRNTAPLPFKDPAAAFAWFDHLPRSGEWTKGNALNEAIETFANAHGIPDRLRGELHELILYDRLVGGIMTVPFVRMRFERVPGKGARCTVDVTDTDLQNPDALELVKIHQKQAVLFNEPIPQRGEDEPHAQYWARVRDWYDMHPGFTWEEIAAVLGYTPQAVRANVAEKRQQ